MKKSKRQKSIDNPTSNYWKHKADAAWGAYMHRRYNRCAVNQDCAGRLESHHLLSRAVRATRHDPANGIMLCSLHHKYSPHCSPHGAPLQFAQWLQTNLPDKWDWVQRHKNDWRTQKANYKEAYERLINETENIK
jgi:hypothetical protein